MDDFIVTVNVSQEKVDDNNLKGLLGDDNKLRRWSQLDNLLSMYVSSIIAVPDKSCMSFTDIILHECYVLEKLLDNDDLDDLYVNCILFCITQLRLCCCSKYNCRYSNYLIKVAFTIYTRSQACYKMLYDCNTFILPHINTLRQYTGIASVRPGIDHENQLKYLKMKANQLSNKRDKYVTLQLDEIHVQAGINYKGGSIQGVVVNNTSTETHTVQAFLICLLFGPLKEMATLVPVHNISVSELADLILRVIRLIQSCGFIVVVVISGNNPINAKAFQILCSGGLEQSGGIPNPDYAGHTLFFMYDTIHILKCIRNYWINQRDSQQSFYYPPINFNGLSNVELVRYYPQQQQQQHQQQHHQQQHHQQQQHQQQHLQQRQQQYHHTPTTSLIKTSFSHLKTLYKSEKEQLFKRAHSLSYKSLYPNNLERQKVSLVLAIFNEYTVTVLKQNDDYASTAVFVDIILSWWKMMNIKTPFKGAHKRDHLSVPFSSCEDARLLYLKCIYDWLSTWEFAKKASGLAKQTF